MNRSIATRVAPGTSLAESRRYCAQLTRRSARNFYYGLRLLAEPKRSAMFALYAYMRVTDDIADAEDGRSVAQRIADLDAWEAQTRHVLGLGIEDCGLRIDEDNPQSAIPNPQLIWPAFLDLARTYSVPHDIFFDAIAGQRQDLEGARINTFDDLHEYCRRVAGVVGLASIHVWGFEGGQDTEALALERGLAFQLTNILRDVWEDSAKGRVYIPREELSSFGLSESDILQPNSSSALVDLMHFQVARARECFERSSALESRVHPDGRASLIAMTAIYRSLLEKIAVDPLRVMRGRVSLSVFTKLRIGWKASRSR
jgi:phytoene synthase